MKLSSVEKVKMLESSIENKVKKIKEEFNVKLSVYEGEVKEREKINEEKVKSMEEILKQTEEDADKEILEIKTKYESELKNRDLNPVMSELLYWVDLYCALDFFVDLLYS